MEKKTVAVGLLAHVDAGKTTLSEAMLYAAGARRALGRVDHGDAFLDTHRLERQRGITIFSKQARLETANRRLILVDTPGHVDFSAETERVMPVLDCAVLVISGTDGVQAHTATLWELLERYRVPTFLFVNKMDMPGAEKESLLAALQKQLSGGCVDFSQGMEQISEAAALCDEALLETYLATGKVTAGNLCALIEKRKLFPVCFGSALKNQGVAELLTLLDAYAPTPEAGEDFAGRVYKISRDPQGNRLTWLRVTGGSLKVRQTLGYTDREGNGQEEKLQQLRLYSGDKFSAPTEVFPGELVAVTGLAGTYVGQGLGSEPDTAGVLEPVMTCRIALPAGVDAAQALPKLRILEEEDPQLHLVAEAGVLHVQIMGQVQLEVFREEAKRRFGLELRLEEPHIFYKETILGAVEGVGHYEPLRHYAEVHLLLEPMPRGSGVTVATICPPDVLESHYQNLILTHLLEKTHRGVLTGAPITDIKLTLRIGKAHVKHTEGGDFRQATYRAVRQGLMQAQSQLLEPWYRFRLLCPQEQIGRGITDIRAMGGKFQPPETRGEMALLEGEVPAAGVGDYPKEVAAYTQGRGQLQLSFRGYDVCHDAPAVIERIGYQPERDLENTPDSIFCAHGGGFTVKWDRVKDYMHLAPAEKEPRVLTGNLIPEDRELEKIMEREFGPIRRPQYGAAAKPHSATEELFIRPPRERYILVDGYNVIFAWEPLAEQAKTDLDAARRQLCDRLSSYAGFTKTHLVVVFDGYKRKGNPGEKTQFHNIQVVYTREGETADGYLQALAHEIGSNYAVAVASSDALVQLSSLGSGVLRISARELENLVLSAEKDMQKHYQ